VRRRLTGEKRGTFPLAGSNFFRRDVGSEREWRRDIALLGSEHEKLRAAVAALAPKGLARHAALVRGIIAHDLYHAGQIQVLKRLRPAKIR
jgi:hypothetical protein